MVVLCLQSKAVSEMLVYFFFLTAVSAASFSKDHNAYILKHEATLNFDGSYRTALQTSNGINAEEKGRIKNSNSKQGDSEVEGTVQWTASDGTPISFHYVANENGYQPQGAHLPTPPPIPPAIQRALEWLSRNPEPQEHRFKY